MFGSRLGMTATSIQQLKLAVLFAEQTTQAPLRLLSFNLPAQMSAAMPRRNLGMSFWEICRASSVVEDAAKRSA